LDMGNRTGPWKLLSVVALVAAATVIAGAQAPVSSR